MPAAPATITCSSCGMQYDGTGMKSGVQFQCTQCQAMVVVGAPAGGKKPLGRATKGPGGAMKAGRPGARVQAGPAGAPGEQQQPYGMPAPKKNNSLMVFGIIAGVVVVGIMAMVVIMSSNKDSQAKAAKEAEAQREKDDKEKQLKQNEIVKKESEQRVTTINAATAAGSKIATALSGNDMNTLSAMFDFDLMQQDFSAQLEKKDKKPPAKEDGTPKVDKKGRPAASDYERFLNHPLFCEGDWEKDDTGKCTGRYIGKVIRGPDSMRKRVMDYISENLAGVGATCDEDAMAKQKTPLEAKFSVTLGGKVYLGRVCMIKSQAGKGKYINFYVGGLQGETNVRIVRFEDPGVLEKLALKEAKREYTGERGEGDFSNPDKTGPDKPKDPKNPDGEEPDGPSEPDLPKAVKTGAQCPQELVNIFRDISAGKEITRAQINTLTDMSRAKKDRKAFIGAVIDVLIDAFEKRDRPGVDNISHALFAVYGKATGYSEKDATWEARTFDEANDYPLRVWYDYYNHYKTE